jgi:hypothetical protein
VTDLMKLGYAVKGIRFAMPKDEDYSVTFQFVSGRWRALATLEDSSAEVYPAWSGEWCDEPDEAHDSLIGKIRRSANLVR